MNIFFSSIFKREAKKLHRNQIVLLEDAIEEIQKNPLIGDSKIGDLTGVRVYKFKMLHQQILIAYEYNELKKEVTLLYFGSHENFYARLKR